MNTQKGFSTLFGLLLVLATVGGGAYWYKKSESLKTDDVQGAPTLSSEKEKEVPKEFENKTISITSPTNGVWDIERTFEYDSTDPGVRAHVTFSHDDSNTKKVVAKMPKGHQGLGPYIVFGGKVYFDSTYQDSSKISYIDPITLEIKDVVTESGSIISMYFADGRIYYLLVDGGQATCLDSYRACVSDFYSLDVVTGTYERKLLAQDLPVESILGMDEIWNGDAWYFVDSWGDAGVWWAKVYKFENQRIALHKEFDESAESDEEYVKFLSSLQRFGNSFKEVRIVDGRLEPVPDYTNSESGKYNFVGLKLMKESPVNVR